jgi:levanase/fructan beta-fructosidase
MLVAVDGAPERAHWVLKVDVDAGLVDGGSGAQYFIGDFDGSTFAPRPDLGDPGGALVDYGPDFYAAATWSDLPVDQPGPVWIGWQSNHQTGKDYPTDPWRGALSLPRRLFLFEEGGRLRLGQRPIAASEALRGPGAALVPCRLERGASLTLHGPAQAFGQHLTLTDHRAGQAMVTVEDRVGPLATVEIDYAAGRIVFRRPATALSPPDDFARATVATPVATLPRGAQVELEVIVDGSLLEIFVDGGRRVYSACIFPQGPAGMHVRVLSGAVDLGRAERWLLSPPAH